MKIICVLLVASFLLIRPAILGEAYTPIGVALSMAAFFLYWLKQRGERPLISPAGISLLFIHMLYWCYVLTQTLVLASGASDILLKNYIINAVIILCFVLILSEVSYRYLFFRWLILIMYGVSISYLITYGLSLFTGIDRLFYYQLDRGGYASGGAIYFPLTPLYFLMHSGNFEFPRLQLIFRESGIAQAFLVWAIFNCRKFGLHGRRYPLVLHLGLIGTFSTTGIAVYFSTLTLYLTLNNGLSAAKLIRGGLALALAVLLLYNAPFIGIKDKSESHGGSIDDRYENSTSGLSTMLESPFGVGFQLDSGSTAGISMIALSQKIGFVGLLLLLLTFWLPLLFSQDRKRYIISIFPIFITALLAQPIAMDPVSAIFIMGTLAVSAEVLPRRSGQQAAGAQALAGTDRGHAVMRP